MTTSATDIRNIYAEELARVEQESDGHRQVHHAALDRTLPISAS